MRHLLKILAVLIAAFVAIGLVSSSFGFLQIEDVRRWLDMAADISSWVIALAIVLLLSVDLLLAVPTLTTTLLAGYYLGIALGSLAAYTGMTICALIGYTLSRARGDSLLRVVLRDASARAELTRAFKQEGPVMILLSRSAPMLPEVCSCLAGATRMRPERFLLLHTASTVPYVLLATYLGSRVPEADAAPAILVAIAGYALLWLVWLGWRKRYVRGERP